jgi:hypothetical protein
VLAVWICESDVLGRIFEFTHRDSHTVSAHTAENPSRADFCDRHSSKPSACTTVTGDVCDAPNCRWNAFLCNLLICGRPKSCRRR